MGKGWIRLYRQSEDNALYFKEPFDKFHAWIDLLLMVNHEPKQFISKKGQLVNLDAGQTITSHRILADRWQWSRNKVRRFLRLLVDTSMCTVDETTNGTTITVVNWAKYQNRGPTNGASDDTNHGANDGANDEPLTRMNKNDKEHKNARARMSAFDQEFQDWIKEYHSDDCE